MSVEKLDFQKVTQQKTPYHVLLRDVIQKIKCPLSLSVWVYLGSLPPEWIINKTQIKNHFSIGEKAIKKVFAYLNKANLIEYVKDKNESGKYVSWSINVLNGECFIDVNLDELSTGSKSEPMEKTTGSKSTRVEIHPHGKEVPIKEIIKTNKIKEKKKYTAKRVFKKPDKKMKREKEHVIEHEKIKRAPMPESLRSFIKQMAPSGNKIKIT